MTWLGITDQTNGRFSKLGLDNARAHALGPMIERGTFMFETLAGACKGAHDLVAVAHTVPWPRALRFHAMDCGGIAFAHQHDAEMTQAAIRWDDDDVNRVLRVSYAWNAPEGWGRLAVERADGQRLTTRPVHLPKPLVTDDVRDIMLAHPARTLSEDIQFCALSDDILPLGPMPSLHPDTPIATPTGYRPAHSLKRGDTVTTDIGEIVPVLQTVRQTVPARGSYQPVCLRAPYFGLQRDIVVAPEQRLVLKGSDVEYIFGQESVLVPARHLVNGQAAKWGTSAALADYIQIILPGHDTIIAAGCPLESLYIGRIRRHATRLSASVLQDMPSRLLPEHAPARQKVLGWFEAITLIDQRAA